MRRLISLAAFAVSVEGTVCAEGLLVDQVERFDVEADEIEWEFQSVISGAAGDGPSAQLFNLSSEYGVSDRLALGFELEAARQSGEGFEVGALSLQGKFVGLDPAKAPVGLGMQFSIGRALSYDETEAELRLLAETRFLGFALAGDLTFEKALSGDETRDIVKRYASRLDWPRSWGEISLEAGGDWGNRDNEGGFDGARHWLGPILSGFLSERLRIEFGYFAGFNDATLASQFRLGVVLRD